MWRSNANSYASDSLYFQLGKEKMKDKKYPSDEYAVFAETLRYEPGMVIVAIPMRSETGLRGAVIQPFSREFFLEIPTQVMLEMLDTAAQMEIEKEANGRTT
jgi:hypothetical protein